VFLAFGSLGLTGCIRKAGPAPSAGFVNAKLMTKPEELPFHKAWLAPGVDWHRFTEIYIAPVHTDYLLAMTWWQNKERHKKIEEDAEKIAAYTQATFQEAFRKDLKHRFQVVEQPGPNTLILEIALVEIVPNKAVMKTLSYAAGPTIGIIGSIVGGVMRQTLRSTVAFEARMRDGATDEILALFADREAAKAAFFDVKNLTWYGHAKSIIKEWADQFIKIVNKAEDEIIKDSKRFQLKPW